MFCTASISPICSGVRPMFRAAAPISELPTPRKSIAAKEAPVMARRLWINLTSAGEWYADDAEAFGADYMDRR
jgi:hypothetical protein